MGQARGDEGLQLPLFVQDGDATVAGAGQGTGPLHHTPQHGVLVQGLGDANTGLANAGEAVSRLIAQERT